ncbi:ribonuclease H-like domain-containing protein [Tanacetum coccineum]
MKVMDPNSSDGKTCLGENVIEISSEKAEGHGDWNSPEYQDTTNSGGKKTKAIIFHKMDSEEVSDRYVAPCFVIRLEVYDGEINHGTEENMISNEFAVKLCLDHELKRGNKVVKKKLIVALRGEIYFVKFIINPEEDDVEPRVVMGRLFVRLTKGIADFENGTVTIYPKLDPFLDSSEEEKRLEMTGISWKNIRNKRNQLEKYLLIYSDMGPSLSTRKLLTQEEAEREALAIDICRRYSLLEEERPVIETMAYSDKYKKILDGIYLDKMKLYGEMKKEEEEAIIKIKGEALIKKEDPRAFMIPIWLEENINLNALPDTGSDVNVMPYRVYKELDREEVQTVKRGITMLNYSKAEPMGLLKDVLCQVGVTTIIAKFLILDMPINRDTPILVGRRFLYTYGSILNTIERITSTFDGIYHQTFRIAKTSLDTAESDSDDEEEYAIQRNKFGAPIYGPKPARYLNCSDLLDRSLALQEVLNPFRKICVWKQVVNFLGSLPVALQHVDWKPDYTGCFNKKRMTMGAYDDEAGSSQYKRSRQYETVEEAMLPRVHHPFLLWEGCNQPARSRYNTKLDQLLPRLIYSPCVMDWNFDEVCAADELKTKKIIKFRLCGRAFSWTLLEFAKRLGLYNSEEIEEEGFDVYFQSGLCSDEHFNAQEYWLSISRAKNLSLSRSHASTIRNPVLRVLHKMITYGLCQRTTRYDKMQKNDLWLLSMFDARHQNGYANVAWLIARWMKRKGAGSQKESMICCGEFITVIAKRKNLLSEEVLNNLSALISYRALDTTTPKELIDSEGRLIPEAPEPGVLRVAVPRPPRASMQDLYERMGNIEIR